MKEGERLERDYEMLWSKSYFGNVMIAIQYKKSGNEIEDAKNPDNRPIYVGFDGDVPRDLEEVLIENRELRHNALKLLGYEFESIKSAHEKLAKDLDRVFPLLEVTNVKHWWEFWK